MRSFQLLLLLFITFFLAGCGRVAEAPASPTSPAPMATATAAQTATEPIPSPTPTIPALTTTVPTPALSVLTPTATATPAPGAQAPAVIEEDEAILILAPGPASRVTSPVRVAGEADSTFEQNLVVRIVGLDERELTLAPTTIAAELGQRGPFEVEVPFEVEEEQQAWIQVFSTSPRDGGITHLAAVGVTLAAGGEVNVVPSTSHPERIVIDRPIAGETISGGVVRVSGRGLASFEQTLVVELLDEEGNVIGSQPVTTDAPNLGEPGSFTAEISYRISDAIPARLVVRDPSPAFSGDVHLASVELFLEAPFSSTR